MLLTITNQSPPATDLGYLLHKHPAKVQTFELSFGKAHVFYPEASETCCTAALLLDVDPVGLVRKGSSGEGGGIDQYVNDRPYVSSSFLSVAIAQVLRSALAGQSKGRPELAEQRLDLAARLAALPCRGGEEFLREVFEPLGYQVTAERHVLDERFPEWGESPYYSVEVRGNVRLSELLTHLYVLIPVLDAEKHYWVGDDEVEKLLRQGEGWLASHPAREAIVSRYLRRQRHLTRAALARLAEDDLPDPDQEQQSYTTEEQAIEAPLQLWQQRIGAIIATLKAAGASRIADLGCGEGKLLKALLEERSFGEILGMDVSHRSLEIAAERLRLDQMPPRQRERIRLIHGSLMYRDARLAGYDAAVVAEVIEHLDSPRLTAFERVVFEQARPGTVVVTTPNAEYNAKFTTLPPGSFRHKDHRFEWPRAEFQRWAGEVAARFGYAVRFLSVGPEDAALGAPTQMGVFSR